MFFYYFGCLQIWQNEIPEFSRPSKQLFPDNYKENPMQRSKLAVISAAFLQKYRMFYLRGMVTGSTHASHCATQPVYATVTDNAQNSMPMITQKFPE